VRMTSLPVVVKVKLRQRNRIPVKRVCVNCAARRETAALKAAGAMGQDVIVRKVHSKCVKTENTGQSLVINPKTVLSVQPFSDRELETAILNCGTELFPKRESSISVKAAPAGEQIRNREYSAYCT